MREVRVPDAVVSATRLGAEVSAGSVPCSWEQVRTRPLRASEEVTHGDKETPGAGPGEVRTPPWLGYSGAPEGPFRAPPRSPSPPPPLQHSGLFGWYKVFPEKRDTGRSRNGCPVSTQPCVLGDLEPRPRAGWVRASLSVQEAQEAPHLSPTTAGRPRPCLPSGQGEGLRSRSRARRSGAKGRAVDAGVVGGVGWQLGEMRRLRGSNAAQGLC